jgi:hypothetical protein
MTPKYQFDIDFSLEALMKLSLVMLMGLFAVYAVVSLFHTLFIEKNTIVRGWVFLGTILYIARRLCIAAVNKIMDGVTKRLEKAESEGKDITVNPNTTKWYGMITLIGGVIWVLAAFGFGFATDVKEVGIARVFGLFALTLMVLFPTGIVHALILTPIVHKITKD